MAIVICDCHLFFFGNEKQYVSEMEKADRLRIK